MLTWHTGQLSSSDLIFPRYLLTFCTDSRRHLLTRREHVDLVLEQILRAACEEEFATAAYCFMPDCAHLLIEGQSGTSNHKRFISRAKQYSAWHYSRAFHERLWQRHGLEHALRQDEATLVIAKHVLEHPVRAGLVSTAADYPFAGSGLYRVSQILGAETRESAVPLAGGRKIEVS